MMKRRSFLLGATALSTIPFLPKIPVEPASVPMEVEMVDLDMVWDPVSRTYRFIAGSNLTWLKDVVVKIERTSKRWGDRPVNAFDVPDSAQLGHVVAVQTHTETIMVPANSKLVSTAVFLDPEDAPQPSAA